MKLRSDFLFTDLSQHFGIYLVVFALKFFIHRHDGLRRDLKSFVVKSKVTQPQPINQKFSKFIKEEIAQRNSMKTKTNWNLKVLLGAIINTITQLNSLSVFFSDSAITLA